MNPDLSFWQGKRVFLTGHTGFKGSWLSIWLQQLGATVRGFALEPPTVPSLFLQTDVAAYMDSEFGDVRDHERLRSAVAASRPEVVFHLAAQPLVRDSYRVPRETYETNFMGTVNLLEAIRRCETVRSVIVITTDKVYANNEWHWGYRETDRLGGYDPYSNSKAAAELAVSAYRSSFFNPDVYGDRHQVALATARAGNVIGGGDWALDRIVPDLVRTWIDGTPAAIRNPHAIRPWQHVLEPLSGYLLLAERLFDSVQFAEEWNFGPRDADCISVGELVDLFRKEWPELTINRVNESGPHEASFLKLDISKAAARIGWEPRWTVDAAVQHTAREYAELTKAESRETLTKSIDRYVST